MNFFMDLILLKNTFKTHEIIEMNPNYQKPIMNLIDKVLRKIGNFPFYLHHIHILEIKRKFSIQMSFWQQMIVLEFQQSF